MLTKIKNHASYLARLLKDNKGVRLFVIAIALIIIVGSGLLVLLLTTKQPENGNTTAAVAVPKPTPAPVKYYSPLTGLEITDQSAANAPVTAVMIENSPDARPQSGVKAAGVVFEAIAEGGITRFAALYQGAKPALIGPVRSVRPYYISWIAPFDASIAHVGGSANALTEVRNGQYRDIDQFFNASTYWRSTDRYAPHNVYTSGEKLDALNQAKGYASSSFTGFSRVDPSLTDASKPQGAAATSINVSISGYYYDPSYTYDAATKTYPRSLQGAPQLDREAGQFTPNVVVVLKVPTVQGFEDGYREQMTVIGSGTAYIFQRGQVFEATWTKASQRDQLKFMGADGKEVPLERGQTWITAIPTEKSVQWK